MKDLPTSETASVDFRDRTDKALKAIRDRDAVALKTVLDTIQHSYVVVGSLPYELLSSNNALSCTDLSFFVQVASAHQIISVLEYIAVPSHYFDVSSMEHFIVEASNALGDKINAEKIAGTFYETTHYHLVLAMAEKAIHMDGAQVLSTALKIIQLTSQAHDHENVVHLQTALKLKKLMIEIDHPVAVPPTSNFRQIEVLSQILETLSVVPEPKPTRLINAFQHGLEIAARPGLQQCSTSVKQAIAASNEAILLQVQRLLGGKSIAAMSGFGNRESKMSPLLITSLMKVFAKKVNDSALPNPIKKGLCNQVAKIVLEGKTNFMPTWAVAEVIEATREHIDFEQFVPSLNARGTINLVDCVADSRPFIHLLKRKHRGDAFGKDLGL